MVEEPLEVRNGLASAPSSPIGSHPPTYLQSIGAHRSAERVAKMGETPNLNDAASALKAMREAGNG
jgi:hypothetical protein